MEFTLNYLGLKDALEDLYAMAPPDGDPEVRGLATHRASPTYRYY